MKKLLCLLLVAVLFSAQSVLAAPAYPYPIPYTLPDGTEIVIQLQGDEWENWRVSEDGYTLLFNEEGFLEYAEQDAKGDLKLSGVRARNAKDRLSDEQAFLSKTSKHLRFSKAQKSTIRQAHGAKTAYLKKAAVESHQMVSGKVRIPIILVEFQDTLFSYSKEDFEMLFNQLDYVNQTKDSLPGSLRDYFLANSYGQLDLEVDVFGIYRLPGGIASYANQWAGGPCQGDPRRMASLAIDSAYQAGADFSKYDIFGSGKVDVVHIIYAGMGTESGGGACKSIWSHAWDLTTSKEYNGKTISKYSCSSELGRNGMMTYIGVIAHELGHALLGLPDLYDTDAANGTAVHPEYWSLMASGNWVDNGRRPSNLSAYEKDLIGWVKATTLTEPIDVFLPHPQDTGVIYRIDTKVEGEYYLLENRQRVNWDGMVPYNSGLVIYRVDKNVFGWNENLINDEPDNRGYYVMQAGCDILDGCADRDTRTSDAWGIEGHFAFTDMTMPSAKSVNGTPTEKPITDIFFDMPNRTLSFKFMGGTVPDYPEVALKDLQTTDYVLGEKAQELTATLENFGKDITSATIHWQVNGEEQTPYEWTGELKFTKSTEVTFGSLDLEEGGAYKISATVVVNNDSKVENNTVGTTIKVYEPFFTEDFEGEVADWHTINGTQTNQWYVGSATASKGEKSAYISNDDANTNAYTTNEVSMVHLYYDVTFPESTDSFDLFFDFKGIGQSNSAGTLGRDFMEIRVVETTETPVAGEALVLGLNLDTLMLYNAWQQVHYALPSAYSGKTQRLVFSWYNNNSLGEQTPAAVDAIIIASRPPLESYTSVALNPKDDLQVLDTAVFGYETAASLVATVVNTGTEAIGELTLALSGTDANSFELSEPTLTNVVVDTQMLFTVAPKTDLAAGTYTATVTVSGDNDISESFDIRFTVVPDNNDAGVEVSFGDETILNLYPNPVTDVLNIQTDETITEIRILNLNGREVKRFRGNQKSLNVQSLPTGLYVVNIYTANGGVISVKIVKQ
ncbi:MAG: M6 family metalloprotease domain-containing protein [Bacteroidales bacterium]|jgi:M6 family metalloprotease-like protein|nr:M6 family metalloprotease domain-containing protein [Bacteroidales bacterium]